jgi:hypothetical protein
VLKFTVLEKAAALLLVGLNLLLPQLIENARLRAVPPDQHSGERF